MTLHHPLAQGQGGVTSPSPRTRTLQPESPPFLVPGLGFPESCLPDGDSPIPLSDLCFQNPPALPTLHNKTHLWNQRVGIKSCVQVSRGPLPPSSQLTLRAHCHASYSIPKLTLGDALN